MQATLRWLCKSARADYFFIASAALPAASLEASAALPTASLAASAALPAASLAASAAFAAMSPPVPAAEAAPATAVAAAPAAALAALSTAAVAAEAAAAIAGAAALAAAAAGTAVSSFLPQAARVIDAARVAKMSAFFMVFLRSKSQTIFGNCGNALVSKAPTNRRTAMKQMFVPALSA